MENEQSQLVFTSVIVKEKNSLSALCLDVDVASEGETIAEAKENLREAVSLYVESAIESNLPIIRPVSTSDNPLHTRSNDVKEVFKISIDVQVNAYV
jgi:hypothetical protein